MAIFWFIFFIFIFVFCQESMSICWVQVKLKGLSCKLSFVFVFFWGIDSALLQKHGKSWETKYLVVALNSLAIMGLNYRKSAVVAKWNSLQVREFVSRTRKVHYSASFGRLSLFFYPCSLFFIISLHLDISRWFFIPVLYSYPYFLFFIISLPLDTFIHFFILVLYSLLFSFTWTFCLFLYSCTLFLSLFFILYCFASLGHLYLFVYPFFCFVISLHLDTCLYFPIPILLFTSYPYMNSAHSSRLNIGCFPSV